MLYLDDVSLPGHGDISGVFWSQDREILAVTSVRAGGRTSGPCVLSGRRAFSSAHSSLPARNTVEKFRRRKPQDTCEQHELCDGHGALAGFDPDNRIPMNSHQIGELLLREVCVAPSGQDDGCHCPIAAV
jgi:hypothetical protein